MLYLSPVEKGIVVGISFSNLNLLIPLLAINIQTKV
jgi:hypothetical protein